MSEQKEMPKYKCHKEVWALGIKSITYFMNGSAEFQPIEQGYGPIHLSIEYIQKHKPQPGGYYVIYEDGYESFSPAKAFEDGYTLIKSEKKMSEEMITISKKKYDELVDRVIFLGALEAAGVDNWEGYDDACEIYGGNVE